MTSVNVTTTKNTVTVNGETRVVTIKTQGPQGPSLPDGDKGDVTVSSNGTAISINSSAITSAKIADGAIVNADINASAAIALSKLATGALPTAITVTSANISDLSIVDADISGSAAISLSKLATGALPTAITVTSANISDLSIVNADINASAAIAGTKISPDFGSQNIVTTGTGGFSELTVTSTFPQIKLTDSNSDSDFAIENGNGNFRIKDVTNNSTRFNIGSNGTGVFSGNLDVSAGLDVTGNITVTGTVDGRDVATDGTKLDGIETGATADQTASEIVALIADQTIAPSTIDMEDNEKIKLGTGDDLEIFHDGGSANHIAASNGSLVLSQTSGTFRIMKGSTENIFKGIVDGAVELFYDNSNKFQTTSTGINVTGNITVTGTVDGRDVATDGTKLDGIETAATADQTAAEIKTLLDSNGIVNSNVDASAAIAGTKISPDFGSQAITTTGNIGVGSNAVLSINALTFTNNSGGQIVFNDGNNQPDYRIESSQGKFQIDLGNSTVKFKINADGHIDLNDNVDISAGLDVTGNITVTGTVDGVDIATRDTLFGGLTSSSGVLTNGVTATTQSASDNSTKVATTAYTDTAIANLVDSAPGTLNTLNELASALGDDANFSTTVTNSIATKMPLAGGTFTGNVTYGNDVMAVFGTGGSAGLLQIKASSNGNCTITENGGGDLTIQSTQNGIFFQHAGTSEYLATMKTDAEVELYYNGNQKFETTNVGVTITGNISVSGTVDGRDIATDGTKLDGIESNATADQTASEIVALVADQTIAPSTIDMEDNEKIKLGTGDDLELYHDGTDTRIQHVGFSGQLELYANDFEIAKQTNASKYIRGNTGVLELYYDNSLKLETISTGIRVTGLTLIDNNKIKLGNSGDLEIYHDGSHSYVADSGTGNLYIQSNHVNIDTDHGEQMVNCIKDGAIELYYDNSKKFHTRSNGVEVTGNTFIRADSSTDGILLIYADNGDDHDDLWRLKATDSGSNFHIDNYASSSWETTIKAVGNAQTELYYDNAKKLETYTAGVEVIGNLRLQSGGAYFSDNVKAHFGNSSDLQIYHDGTDSYIKDAGTGRLMLLSNQFQVNSADNSEIQISAIENGAVNLYYNGSKKFETTSAGVSVTGNIAVSGTVDGVDVAALNTTVSGKLSNIVEDTSPQLGGDLDTNGHHILIDENHAIKFGASNEFNIQHNTNQNYIQSNSGNIYIRANVDDDEGDNIYIQPKSGENSAVFTHDGAVELYFDNSKKVETYGAGLKLAQNLWLPTGSGGAFFDDSIEAKFGIDQDLKIYHDGSHSRIYNTTGNLSFRSSSYYFNNSAGTENCLDIVQNGAVSLYYDHSKKFETISSGVQVSGTLFIPDGGQASNRISIGNSGDLQIYHDGSHSRIIDGGTGNLMIQSDNAVFIKKGTSEDIARFNVDGAVELLYDNSKKFETTSYGAQFTDNVKFDNPDTAGRDLTWEADNDALHWEDNTKATFGAGNDLQIYHASNISTIKDNYGDLRIQSNTLRLQPLVGNENFLFATEGGTTRLFYDGATKFETTSTGATVTGQIVADGLSVGDSDIVKFGSHDDLQIYHDGSHSYITEVGTGHLYFGASGYRFNNAAQSESIIQADQDGAVELYYDNSKKFETTSIGVTLSGDLKIPDGEELRLGTSNDLQIYHDGSNSYIENSTGGLFIKNTDGSNLDIFSHGSARIRVNAGETAVDCSHNSSVDLYFNNVKKFETTSTGVSVTGTHSATKYNSINLSASVNHIQWPQDASDSNSRNFNIIGEQGQYGVLDVKYANARDENPNEKSARFVANGDVELYYDNSKKFYTTSTGAYVEGFLLAADNGGLKLGSGNDLQIFHDGSHSRIYNYTGNLAIDVANDIQLRVASVSSPEMGVDIHANGSVDLYYDNSKKFETISSGASITGFLGIGTNNPAEFLQIYKYRSYNNDADMYMCLGTNDDAVNNNAVYKWRHGITGQAYGYNYIWETLAHTQSSYVERMRLHKDGRLGIGSDSIIDSENRLTVKNDTASKVAHFHHNHDSQRSCIDCTNGHATGGQSAIMIEFRRADGGSVGGIFASTSAAQYNTASDYRLKENQVAISDGITRLKELKPYKFNFKENKDKIVDGFFAHEVSSVVPEAITGTKDEVDENNDPIYQGIDQSKLVPLLVAAVQELIGRVEKLEGA